MSLIIAIRVTPSSGRSTFSLDAAGKLKAYLKNPPQEGKANAELIKLLAKGLNCSQACVHIIAGSSSKNKRIKIDLPLTYDDLIAKLGFAVQTKII